MKTKLTQRESMVWAMAANGSRDKQIASELGLSRQRVSDILVSLRRKLGIERQGARMSGDSPDWCAESRPARAAWESHR